MVPSRHYPVLKSVECFAASHATGHHKELTEFLDCCTVIDFEKGLTLLDRPRQTEQTRKKVAAIELAHPHLANTDSGDDDEKKKDGYDMEVRKRKRSKKIDQYRYELRKLEEAIQSGDGCGQMPACAAAHADTAVSELIHSTSCSGALARKIRQWAKTLRPDYLEFIMLEMPKIPWQKVSDLVHFKPDDFLVPYFLDDMFGKTVPADSFVSVMRSLYASSTADAGKLFVDVVRNFPQVCKNYASLRLKRNIVGSPVVVENLARNMPLDTLIWYFEELECVNKRVGDILKERLAKPESTKEVLGNDSKLNAFGKLLERILMFQRCGHEDVASLMIDMATNRLNAMKEQFHSVRTRNKKIAVFGDASASKSTLYAVA